MPAAATWAFITVTPPGANGQRRSMGTYLVGTVGNEHLQITVGASYDESNYRIPARVTR
jgi:hypothetical protein